MKSILIVDDSPTMRASIADILVRNRFAVDSAESGEDAVAQLKSGCRPNLIITDLNMPGMDGIALIRAVRKLPRQRFTPILVLTTESKSDLRKEAKAAGATGWIVKPVTEPALMQVLDQILP